MRVRLIVPDRLDKGALTARVARVPQDRIGADVAIEPVGIARPLSLSDEFEWTLHAAAVLAAGLAAEDDGCDAVIISSITDPALYALRSRLTIPVVGAGLASFTLALTLGRRFSIVLPAPRSRRVLERTLRLYQLVDKCASIREAPELDDEAAARGQLSAGVVGAATAAIDTDGADVVVLGATAMHATAQRLAETLPQPVVDPGLVALQTAERMLLLGLSHSKTAFPTPRTLQDKKVHTLLEGTQTS